MPRLLLAFSYIMYITSYRNHNAYKGQESKGYPHFSDLFRQPPQPAHIQLEHRLPLVTLHYAVHPHRAALYPSALTVPVPVSTSPEPTSSCPTCH
jgi:hypothetical protein